MKKKVIKGVNLRKHDSPSFNTANGRSFSCGLKLDDFSNCIKYHWTNPMEEDSDVYHIIFNSTSPAKDYSNIVKDVYNPKKKTIIV